MKTLAFLTIAAVTATGAFAQERGRVLSSTPITQQVAVPQQVCSDQPVAVAPRSTGAGAVVGAIAGGLLGNASRTAEARSLACPCASFAIRSAVAGATTTRSASRDRRI